MRAHVVSACPGCSSPTATRFPFGPPGHELNRCSACGLVYAVACADPDEIYVDGYLFGDTDFGLDVADPFFQEFLDHAATVRMERIEKVVGAPGSFLDVGCGTGEVLEVAARRGWEAVGVDPIEDSIRFAQARGVDARNTLLEDSGLPERSFDVVSAFHVLEHMTDGLAFLRLIARWVRPGGHLVLEVPNWRSFHRRSYDGSWPNLRPLEHVAHYTPATLGATLGRAGLDPVHVGTIGFLWDQQSVRQQMGDLGLLRGIPRAERVLGRPGAQPGKAVRVPNAAGRVVLGGVAKVYDLARTGQAAFAIARVP